MTTPQTDTKPSGPVAAAFVAAGIGSFVMGLFVTLNELGGDISTFLKFDANFGIGKGVGPLSGKVTLAVLAFIISWVVLHFLWRGKEVNFGRAFTAALILVGLGFLLTFPPIFLAFAPAS
jgi:glycerol-3-phosphate acyltransferase PlsY